jgi:hypothetical protein
MITGYIYQRVKVPPKVPFAVNIALWSISLFILFVIIFGVEDGQLNVAVTSLYVSLGHTGNCCSFDHFQTIFTHDLYLFNFFISMGIRTHMDHAVMLLEFGAAHQQSTIVQWLLSIESLSVLCILNSSDRHDGHELSERGSSAASTWVDCEYFLV